MELLAPAGNSKNFIQAINNGADAIYLGLTDFSARGSAENFSLENLPYYIAYAHFFNVKVYVAMNILVKNSEIDSFISKMIQAHNMGVDAFIVQDVFLGKYIKDLYPEITLHLSTQAGINNLDGAKLAKEFGFSRVILSRETALNEIKEIAEFVETEVFVHGAMCSSFSGHCYFSSFVGGNSGNRGLCKQPCRKAYKIYGNDKIIGGEYRISLSDLMLCDEISLLKEIGVASVKIEGRMRSEEYVAKSVALYYKAIHGKDYSVDKKEIKRIYNRGDYTKGYLFNQKNLISDKIQSHKGDFFDKVKKVNGKVIYCNKQANENDSFKIIRNGVEIGNALFNNGKFVYHGNAKFGDELYITKDVELVHRVLSNKKNAQIDLIISLKENRLAVKYKNQEYLSDEIVEQAKNDKSFKEEMVNCFAKTDAYPFISNITFNDFYDKIFIPKSLLNEFRREVYSEIFFAKQNIKQIKIKDIILKNNNNYDFNKKIVLSSFIVDCDYFVYCPEDYSKIEEIALTQDFKKFKGEKFLFIPAFLNDDDKKLIVKALPFFDGVYADGISGLTLGKNYNKKIIAGVGLNIFNSVDVAVIEKEFENVLVVYSKELSLNEMKEKRFVYAKGSVSLMELEYCPFKKRCNECQNKNEYVLKDDKYSYLLYRYKLSSCRFIVNNCALLKTDIEKNVLINLVGLDKTTALKVLKGDYSDLNVNGGRLKKGVL